MGCLSGSCRGTRPYLCNAILMPRLACVGSARLASKAAAGSTKPKIFRLGKALSPGCCSPADLRIQAGPESAFCGPCGGSSSTDTLMHET